MERNDLNRFLEAQEEDYDIALREIKEGRKRSHWMWYIFPQMVGLGYSSMAKRYGIKDLKEAEAYLQHPVLGVRLIEISRELLKLQEQNPTQILGTPDDMKLHSSMTLFSSVPGADEVFEEVLAKFFAGRKDRQTLQLIGR
ncbi:DUF1810 domain-containing protein [Desertivirga arenae]|uniref:DUF1810 domain-containing protein n=1 Tax=Desertivirga arenae TaxID=2810309 RepID=UPI001A965C6B|nr:DUF1810 domain-containing protein [Pedobacter sp. SYSU D00823]